MFEKCKKSEKKREYIIDFAPNHDLEYSRKKKLLSFEKISQKNSRR